MPSRSRLRQLYRNARRDSLRHGETDLLTFDEFVAVYELWVTMANTDPGGDIRL